MSTLGTDQLNRATLQRQLLLRREPETVRDVTRRIVALQAQSPPAPYIALWTRLAGFDANGLDGALRRRELVKATLGRSTLHLVSTIDYRATVTALLAVTRTRWMQEQRGRPVRRPASPACVGSRPSR